MKSPKFPWFALLMTLLMGFFAMPSAWPQASVNVSTLDSVYRDIDKLVAHGLVDKIIVGQRPYSRRTIARITAEAMSHLSRLKGPLEDPSTPENKKQGLRERLNYVNGILLRLQKDYREELVQLGALEGKKSWYSAHLIEKAILDVTVTNSPPEPLPKDNGIGGIDAVINPLVDYRQGRHIVDGGTMALETTHWFRVTDYLAFYARPRFQLGLGRNLQPNDNEVFVQNLYGKINVKNFEIEVGRDNLVWGQGQDAGLLLSNNPRGLDMIKIGNDDPFFLPWVFKYIGANKITFFYADLGPEQNFPNAYLAGYKWSIQPLSFFELGLEFMVQSGGEGSPSASFGERVGDLFPFTQVSGGAQDAIGNKFGGGDFRFRIPPARGLELYAEAVFDDVHGNLSTQFVDDAAYIGGVYLPRLTNSGSADLRLEYHYTGLRFYRHSQFTSGLTLNQYLIADNLGPNAQGFYLTSNFDVNRSNRLTFTGAFEARGSDQYKFFDTDEDPNDPLAHFTKLQDNPTEFRYRVTTEWLHRVSGLPLDLQVLLGYERAQNFNFTSGNDRNNFLSTVSLTLNLDALTRFPR